VAPVAAGKPHERHSLCASHRPEARYAVGEGDRWECELRGLEGVARGCEEIIPPAHGYLDASGYGCAFRDSSALPTIASTAGNETQSRARRDAHEEAPCILDFILYLALRSASGNRSERLESPLRRFQKRHAQGDEREYRADPVRPNVRSLRS